VSRVPFPKIELHVHLEGTVRPHRLLQIAGRNHVDLPVSSEEGLTELYRFRDFAHFIDVWIMTTHALRTEHDFREIVVDYAREAAGFGAVYLEGIFSPAERVKYGPSWDEVFSGFCDGADEARERFGIEVGLTPDIPRDLAENELDGAETTVDFAMKYRERGVVGVGLGGLERHRPEPFAHAFRRAKEGGLGSVPHAGEAEGPSSVWGALDALSPDRIRHGVRAVEDPALVERIAELGIVLDVCPLSNVRTGVFASLEQHPLPQLLAAGIRCTVNTDDPAMFDTDLDREHQAVRSLGVSAQAVYEAGTAGALCDDAQRARLRAIGRAFDWSKT
jgi:aminodeoxyfutalosine deaminase